MSLASKNKKTRGKKNKSQKNKSIKFKKNKFNKSKMKKHSKKKMIGGKGGISIRMASPTVQIIEVNDEQITKKPEDYTAYSAAEYIIHQETSPHTYLQTIKDNCIYNDENGYIEKKKEIYKKKILGEEIQIEDNVFKSMKKQELLGKDDSKKTYIFFYKELGSNYKEEILEEILKEKFPDKGIKRSAKSIRKYLKEKGGELDEKDKKLLNMIKVEIQKGNLFKECPDSIHNRKFFLSKKGDKAIARYMTNDEARSRNLNKDNPGWYVTDPVPCEAGPGAEITF